MTFPLSLVVESVVNLSKNFDAVIQGTKVFGSVLIKKIKCELSIGSKLFLLFEV